MSRLESCFETLRGRGERALIPFLTVGDPDVQTTAALVRAMAEAGADAVELGVPFSDPIAEGPTIQRASERALRTGVTLRRVLELTAELRQELDLPLVLMGYANPIFAMGAAAFAESAAAVGVDGIIVPDLPPEEGREIYGACRDRGVDPVLLAAPTTTPKRLERLGRETRGFLYYVSLTGVTGARGEVAGDVEAKVRRVKSATDKPVCVGFGISKPEHAQHVGTFADGVIVGSAVVDRIEAARDRDEAVDAVSAYITEMKAPLRG
ncbi:MAG: tryptophan synthase subunit alpha [Proteobacteria bacterium]|nr:tryptophan synthase subunit alpha [Pseudomonadota bacterium]